MNSANSRQLGQGLLELSVCLSGLAAVFLAASALLMAEWQRARCAYRAFEVTHGRLLSPEKRTLSSVRFEETPFFLRGEARCGRISEQITFPKLESADLRADP